MNNNSKKKNVYFVGIGGVGVSALARIYLAQGYKVSGEDAAKSIVTDDLISLGVAVEISRGNPANLKGVDLVIYSQALPKSHPVLEAAKKRKIKTLTYPQALGLLTKTKPTICVCGSHGKTTTTSLIGLSLLDAGCDPTIVVGSFLEQIMGNAKLGEGKYMVVEADEYRQAFLNLHPQIAVITNIEYEHPDCYRNLAAVKEAFAKFIKRLPADGIIIANYHDQNIKQVIKSFHGNIITYGFSKEADFWGVNYHLQSGHPVFEIINKGKSLGQVKLAVPGKHNALNALAAGAVMRQVGINFNSFSQTMANYKGAWRRFEKKATCDGAVFYDDYAHHPTEIKATLSAARDLFPKRKIIAIFQPHHQSRFHALYDEFLKCFENADEIFVMDVYKVMGREEKKLPEKYSPNNFVKALTEQKKKVYYTPRHQQVLAKLKEIIKKGDVVITLGAGDVNTVARKYYNFRHAT
ncbi:MAG: hypothetical protein ACD_68C00065G0003 [uncultured bacterium]|nr:MAG: hypothetical protein ACD_68C00065G0003 [uncultured bacterium]